MPCLDHVGVHVERCKGATGGLINLTHTHSNNIHFAIYLISLKVIVVIKFTILYSNLGHSYCDN